MQPEQILSSDLLDILFADRNKLYGAYPLRRGYNKRLTKALFITGFITGIALLGYYSSKEKQTIKNVFRFTDTIELTNINLPDEPKPPVPPLPPPPARRQVAMRDFATPLIVKDSIENEIPPIADLDRSIIGPVNQDGIDAPDIVPTPSEGNNAVTEAPAASTNDFVIRPEIESSYPGGMSAWKRFLIKTFRYPTYAQENEIQGRVTVKFVVDADGNVSNIEAIAGPEELRAEAVRVIGKSGKWTPAMQNGNHVKSYKVQQIIFELQTE